MAATATRHRDPPALDEAGLARAAAAGDGAAFALLYGRCEPRAFNLAYRITGSEADAADAVQEAFLGAMRSLPRLADRELAFGPHLAAATHDACRKLMGRRRHGRPGEPTQGELPAANARLPQRQRAALALRELGELSYAEIGAIMATGPSTVAQLISRARINLCDELRGTVLASVGAPSPDCERALPLIAMRDDGQLEAGSGEATWLDLHLAGCDRCRLGVEAMLEAAASYRAWEPIAAAPRLRRETTARVAAMLGADWSGPAVRREERVRERPPRRRPRLASALAALLLLTGLALALARKTPPAVPTKPVAGSAPQPSGPKRGAKAVAKGRAKGDAAKKTAKPPATAVPRTLAARTSLATVPATAPQPAPSATGSPPSEPASGPSRHGGRTAVQPTQPTSTPKHAPKPALAPPSSAVAPPPSAPASPAPATEEPPPAEESAKEAHRRNEPPGKPPGRPPR